MCFNADWPGQGVYYCYYYSYIYIYIYTYVDVCVCMCISLSLYTYIYIYIYMHMSREPCESVTPAFATLRGVASRNDNHTNDTIKYDRKKLS